MKARSRGYLPHLERQNAIYFVTFRLADSLPQELVLRIRQEREALQKAIAAGSSVAADELRLRALRHLLEKAERCLDGGLGHCYRHDPRIARVVADALHHDEGDRYQTFAWCVMPNHVHAVVSIVTQYRLEAVLHSWKSFSALAANRLLGRTGPFWQREYFDHSIRNEGSLQKIIQYVRENPRRARLRNWPWVG
jgi:REP element-mobilizing transposase RayT